jgi:hypothetical protein
MARVREFLRGGSTCKGGVLGETVTGGRERKIETESDRVRRRWEGVCAVCVVLWKKALQYKITLNNVNLILANSNLYLI